MRRSVALLVFLSSVLVVPVAARAEDPMDLDTARSRLESLRREQVEVVRRLVHEGDDRALAWGATWAREAGLTEVVPDLLAVLHREAVDADAVGYYGMLAVFDALVQLDARPNGEDLVPFLGRRHGRGHDHRAPAVILAVRGGDPHALLALFDALDREDGSWEEGWLALGNALAARKVTGFARRTLERVEVVLQVTVRDPDDRRGYGGGSRSLGLGCGDGRLPERVGYPDVYRYDLTRYARDGYALLAGGPTPIHVERRRARRGFGTTSRSPQRRTEHRLDWIATLLDRDVEDLPLRRRHHATVTWGGAAEDPAAVEAERARVRIAQYRASIDAAREKIRAAHGALLEALVLEGVLSLEEARGLEARIRVDVVDRRSDTAEVLPAVGD